MAASAAAAAAGYYGRWQRRVWRRRRRRQRRRPGRVRRRQRWRSGKGWGAGGGGLGAGGGVFVQQGGTLIINAGTVSGGSAIGGVGGTNYPGTSGSVPGGAGTGAGSGIFIQGTQTVTFSPAAGTTLTVDDVIADQTGSGGTGTNAAAGTLVIDGLGTVVLAADNHFTGGIVLGNGTLDLAATGAAGSGVITFGADPVLEFSVANAPANAIDHFFAGSTIEIAGFLATGSQYVGSHLTLDGAGGPVTLDIPGLVFNDVTVSDNSGNTYVYTSQVLCFAAGTRIATPDGGRAVETLQAGDHVVALDAEGRRTIGTVRWVGIRTLRLTDHPEPALAAPVRIRADAIATGIPARDVVVSPDHCVLMNGHLLRAFRLINGVSVMQEFPRAIAYVHIELDRHALLLAEGMPAESYLDEGYRGFFDGTLALPGPLHDRAPMVACAPFAPDDAFAERIWRDVAGRAGAALPAPPAPPSVMLVAGERTLRPVVAKGSRRVFVLPRGTRQVRLVSTASRPCDARPWAEDRRWLGLCVRRIGVDGARALPLDGPALGPGWHAPEHGASRWTDGDAHVRVPAGTRVLELRLAQ